MPRVLARHCIEPALLKRNVKYLEAYGLRVADMFRHTRMIMMDSIQQSEREGDADAIDGRRIGSIIYI